MALGPKNQRDQIKLVIGIAAIGLAVAYWWFLYTPKAATLAEQTSRVENLEANNDKAKAEMAKGSLERLRQEAVQFQKNLEVMRQLVPTSNEVPTLLEQVSTAARRAGLDLSGVEPVPVIEGEQFDTYKYKVTVTGAYHPLAAFLTNVGSLTRIIAPVNLGLGASNNQPSYASGTARAFDAEARLECKFEIQTYVVRTAPKPAPAKEAKKS